jgi:hypothetical protein
VLKNAQRFRIAKPQTDRQSSGATRFRIYIFLLPYSESIFF